MNKSEGVVFPGTTDTLRKHDFARRLGGSRIYQDYEQAFGKTTKLPLELSSIDVLWRAKGFKSSTPTHSALLNE